MKYRWNQDLGRIECQGQDQYCTGGSTSPLKEAHRVLAPGGKILLTTPNYGSLWPLLEKIVNARAEVTYEEPCAELR